MVHRLPARMLHSGVVFHAAISICRVMTGAYDIPEAVQALLRDHVTSFEALAALLLLRSNPNARWSVEAIAREIRMLPDSTVAALQALRASALVACQCEGAQLLCQYAPGNPWLASAADALAQAFEDHRVAVISCMNANALERVRSGAIRTFSDAFLIKKKEGQDG
jgi:hypothetical protein